MREGVRLSPRDVWVNRLGLAIDAMAHFDLETLYRCNREPLHLIIDEADEVAPQRAHAGVERLLGAAEDIVRRGRVRGLGVSLISQRPAALSKSVLSQVDALILLGVTAPQDTNAVVDWVAQHSEQGQAQQLKASLPALPIGEAWIWSPEWLGITRRIVVRRRETFDSSSTPKAGAARIIPAQWASVDVADLRRHLEGGDDKDRSDGVVVLRRKLCELEAALDAERAKAAAPVEIPVITDAQLAAVGATVRDLRELAGQLAAVSDQLCAAVANATRPSLSDDAGAGGVAAHRAHWEADLDPAAASSSSARLGKAERQVLTALAQHGVLSAAQIALLTGRSKTSGGFRNCLSKLRSEQLICGRGNAIEITEGGRTMLGHWQPLPEGPELVRWWCAQLPRAARQVLLYLADNPDRAVPLAELAAATNYSATSGGFRNSLSKLRTLGLASGRGELKISPELVRDAHLDVRRAV